MRLFKNATSSPPILWGMMHHLTLLAGTANPALAEAIADDLGLSLGACRIQRFPDSEVSVELKASIRNHEVFLLQPTLPPVDQHLMELIALADACRRASARRVVAVVPYFGYARSDKRGQKQQAIMASVVAQLLQAVGIHHLITVDLHAPQIQGFFQGAVDSIAAAPVLCKTLRDRLPANTVIVSPDTGRMDMAIEYAHHLATDVAVLHKQRKSGTETEVTQVVGEVGDRPCLIIDDMVATGSTLINTIKALRKAGAGADIFVSATHGLFVKDALDQLAQQPIQQIFITDTIPVLPCDRPPLQKVSVAAAISAAIRRTMVDA
ncbi:MAG: ribose-phosphate pyrophosphokinase [Synechococcales bacterium]|nr:ribose-phosphate pyrophosphokinase [Synechococcales bacterium]